MFRTVAASLVFAAIYGVAIRCYLVLRTRREATRWHLGAVALAGGIGGLAFYAALQVRQPHRPVALDLAAFLIMALAASAIPVILEVAGVVQARLLRQSRLKVPGAAKVEQSAKGAE